MSIILSCPVCSTDLSVRVTSHFIVQSQINIGKTSPSRNSSSITAHHLYFWLICRPFKDLDYFYTCAPLHKNICFGFIVFGVFILMHVFVSVDSRLHYLTGCAGVTQGCSFSQHHALRVAPRPGHLPPLYGVLPHTQSEYIFSHFTHPSRITLSCFLAERPSTKVTQQREIFMSQHHKVCHSFVSVWVCQELYVCVWWNGTLWFQCVSCSFLLGTWSDLSLLLCATCDTSRFTTFPRKFQRIQVLFIFLLIFSADFIIFFNIYKHQKAPGLSLFLSFLLFFTSSVGVMASCVSRTAGRCHGNRWGLLWQQGDVKGGQMQGSYTEKDSLCWAGTWYWKCLVLNASYVNM